jgi:TetR/AcrR family transcriptional regulator
MPAVALKPSSIKKKLKPKSEKATNSSNQLLDSASSILAERHSLDVSFTDIAEHSGLNAALIKYYFGSKDGLLLALVRRDAAAALAQLNFLVDLKISPEKKVALHVAGVIKTYIKYPYLNSLIHALLGNEDERIPHELSDFFVQPLVDAQTKILDEGVAQGIFRPIDPMFFYYAIIGACDHLFFARVSRKFVFNIGEISPKMRDEYIDFVTDMTLRLLKKD